MADIDTQYLDADTDKIKPARAAILEAVQRVNTLSASSGSSLINWIMSGTGAAARTVQAKLRDFPTVEDYGAVGDGATDDSAAFIAMAAANGGLVRTLNKRYFIDELELSGNYIALLGAGKPTADAGFTKLENGTVLVGTVTVRALACHAADFGVDAGTFSALASTTEGLVIDAPTGQRGKHVSARNIATLGSLEASATHSVLIEGFDENAVDNIDCALRVYGVVVKGRKGFVSNIRAYHIQAAPVFIKADLPAYAGSVLDATVSDISVRGVKSYASPSNTDCNHVYVQASTEFLSNVSVSDVFGTFGNAAVRVAGGAGTPYTSSVHLSNITSEQGVTGVDLFGTTYDTSCDNLRVNNPSSGKAFTTGGSSNNWKFTNVDLLITTPAIGFGSPADMSGTGMWDNFSVRNGNGTMAITYDATNIIGGAKRGDVTISGEGAPTMSANWTGAASGYAPLKVWREPGTNTARVVGPAYPGAGAASIALVLPAGFRPTNRLDFANVISDSGTIGYVIVYSDGTVQIPGFVVGSVVTLNLAFQIS